MTTSQPESPSPSTEADQRLITACLIRADGAWEAFVDRFGGLLAFVADRTARQRGLPFAGSDRDDLVADMLLECLRNDAAVLRGFAGRASLATYLTVIARRVAARKLASRTAVAPTVARPTPVGSDHDHLADREHVATLLRVLPPDEAKLVRLHHLEHRSYGDISRLTGLPLNSIGPALSRAREKMRRHESAQGDPDTEESSSD